MRRGERGASRRRSPETWRLRLLGSASGNGATATVRSAPSSVQLDSRAPIAEDCADCGVADCRLELAKS
eukprot:45771-Alexandrium_andersonii.AAC.1